MNHLSAFIKRLALSLIPGIMAIWLLVAGASASSQTVAQAGAPIPGSLDANFGQGGIVTTSIVAGYDIAHAVAVQNDGRIVLAGCVLAGSFEDFALARYTASGVLDPSFGVGGITTTHVSPYYACVNDLVIQNDGGIVAAGYAYYQGPYGGFSDFAVARYLPTGALDTGFGNGGAMTISVGTADDGAQGVALQPDGKIVAVGSTREDGSSSQNTAIVRYTISGTLDMTFGVGGVVTIAVSAYDNWANDVAVQADSKIVVVGGAQQSQTSYDFFVLRYTTAGALDPTFGVGGIVTTSIASGVSDDLAYSIALQDDGKIVVAGGAYDNRDRFALVRYTVSGTLDTGFGNGGMVTTPISLDNSTVQSIAIQDDGKIVAAGYVYDPFSSYDFAVARYTLSGTLDTTFGGTGVVTAAISTGRDYAYDVAIQGDGKIVVAGDAYTSNSLDFAVVRYIGQYAVYLPLILINH